MIEIIKERIKEKNEWIESTQVYLDTTNYMTKKERNHYLKEMILQSNLIEELEEVLQLYKLKTLNNE